MAKFHFRAMTATGEIVSDYVNSENKFEATTALQGRGLRIISMEEEGAAGLGQMKIGTAKKMNLKSLVLFCRQLATLLRSGVPLIQCFDIISEQSSDKFFKDTLVQISQDIQAGSVLSVAIEKQGMKFPAMLSKMIAIGEETGDMAAIMDRLANQYESSSRIRNRVKGALTYPLVLLSVALIACVFMLIVIVPQFAGIFDQLGTELPGLTQALLSISDFLVSKWYIAVIVFPTVIILLIRFLKTPKAVRVVDRIKLSFKLIKGPMQKMMAAQFARTLHTLVSSGIPIVAALESTKENVDNVIVKDAIDEISLGIQKGKGLSEQMKDYDFFPNMLVSMISIGEASGNMEEMLSKTADYYDEELDTAIGQLMTLLEPTMILIVGGLIGVIVMSLYAPMFGAITALQDNL